MIRRMVCWISGALSRFYSRKVEQARAPQERELDWLKDRAGRVETELQSVLPRPRDGRGAWRVQ